MYNIIKKQTNSPKRSIVKDKFSMNDGKNRYVKKFEIK